MLNPGDAAPLFSLPDADGRDVRLADFRDKWVVLYFYPKDNTSGCTKEAVDFTSLAGRLCRPERRRHRRESRRPRVPPEVY